MRTGIARADGDLIMIQDADLEYEPDDYIPMIEALISSGADAVYGSRYLGGGKHPGQSWGAYIGGRSLSLVQWWFTGRMLTDTVTALKLFRAPVLKSMPLETSGFELDHEITSRLRARGGSIREVPIRVLTPGPRGRQEDRRARLVRRGAHVREYSGPSGGRTLHPLANRDDERAESVGDRRRRT